MTELQSKLLDMFKWFHEFCMSHGLRYYMIGGTMLGAARHKGFIPWDDDIDVGMPRPDYEKLEQLMKLQGEQRYILETPRTEALDYFYPISKLYDTQTTLVENTRLKIRRGIFLDIFPLDGIGDSEEESRRNYKAVHWKHNLLLTRVTGIREGRSKLKNAAVRVARLVPGCILDNKKLLLNLEKQCKKYSFEVCSWAGNLLGAYGTKELAPKKYFGKPKLYEFEGQLLFGPQRAEEYLTQIYGDWRKLPPKEKQVSHHDFIEFDLNKSFLEEPK